MPQYSRVIWILSLLLGVIRTFKRANLPHSRTLELVRLFSFREQSSFAQKPMLDFKTRHMMYHNISHNQVLPKLSNPTESAQIKLPPRPIPKSIESNSFAERARRFQNNTKDIKNDKLMNAISKFPDDIIVKGSKAIYPNISSTSGLSTLEFTEPKQLINYKISRNISEIKIRLRELQDTFISQAIVKQEKKDKSVTFPRNSQPTAFDTSSSARSMSHKPKLLNSPKKDVAVRKSGRKTLFDEDSDSLASGLSTRETPKFKSNYSPKEGNKNNANERQIGRTGKTKRDRLKALNSRLREDPNLITLPNVENIQVIELSHILGVTGGDLVKHLMMERGMMVSLTKSIDIETAKQCAASFGKIVKAQGSKEDNNIENKNDNNNNNGEENCSMIPRPPVVTIMGHVDHGKTTLLDGIRKHFHSSDDLSNFLEVAPGEAGGITQSITAFNIQTKDSRNVTFIDTPGHAAFSDMRKRGAHVTDIVVLVIAADDGIMEQTKECILAAQEAKCPIVIAINKIDKEGIDIQSILTDLTSFDILSEEYGGDVQVSQLSAKKGLGLDDLIEKILLQADVMELYGNPNASFRGTVIESKLDKRNGVVATILVQEGTLRVGDILLAGSGWGRVKKILFDKGKVINEAGPSTPVQVLGFNAIPDAGDQVTIVEKESNARGIAEARARLARLSTIKSASSSRTLESASFVETDTQVRKELISIPLLLKADVSGSLEAISLSLRAIQAVEKDAVCSVDLIHAGIGDVTASDVAIASASKAKILGFNVGCHFDVLELARASNVVIGFYDVLYNILDEIEKQVKETVSPPPPGEICGTAEVKQTFRLGKSRKIAGCRISLGYVKPGYKIRIMRGSRNSVYSGQISSLKTGKVDAEEVREGEECGMVFDDFQDFEVGDIVEVFTSVTTQKSS